MSRSPFIHFILVGLALFGLRVFWDSGSAPGSLEIHRSQIDEAVAEYERTLRREATDAERIAIEGRVIDDALWLAQARALGLPHVDSVVQQRLLMNMRFLAPDPSLSDTDRLRRAFELGLEKSDPIVRRRLIDRVQALIRTSVRSRTPEETSLRSHYQLRAERWRVPDLLDLSHVYLSRDQRGSALAEDAVRLLRLLIEEPITVEAAILRGDPFLSGHQFQRATPNQISAKLGSVFEARLAEARTEHWLGPIESPFGLHLVWIAERIESQIPPYHQVRTQVLEDWFREETRKALQSEIERHRDNVAVRIIAANNASLTSPQSGRLD